jgi:hypothetical protein
MNIGEIIRDSFLGAFLNPAILKMGIIFALAAIFLGIVKILFSRILKEKRPKIKTKTLMIIELAIIVVSIVGWLYWYKY